MCGAARVMNNSPECNSKNSMIASETEIRDVYSHNNYRL
jgi:hypothetical protein